MGFYSRTGKSNEGLDPQNHTKYKLDGVEVLDSN